MTKSKAIRQKCYDCAGEMPSEVTFCPVVTCPLWPYRFGYSPNDKRFKKRMKSAKNNYPNDYDELLEILKDYIQKNKNGKEIMQINYLMCSL